MELANWRELCDRGPDLVACLDFPGVRPAAGFAELAAGVPDGACFLHIGPASAGGWTGGGPLAACAARWADELVATGRPVRAVFGFCAGAALATRVADAVAGAGEAVAGAGKAVAEAVAGGGEAPLVVLFDAVPATGEALAGEFVVAVESNARHLTAEELADAHGLAEQAAADPDDLARIAATLTGRYDQLMRAVAGRLSVPDLLRKELTGAFTAYLDYLLLASEGGFDMRTATPLFVTSPDHELPVQGARAIAVDVAHDDLLRDPQIHKLVAGLLTGEHPW